MNVYLSLLQLLFQFGKNVQTQKAFFAKVFLPLLNSKCPEAFAQLDATEKQRLEKYAIMIPAMPGESYCVLRKLSLSHNERLGLTALGALTALFDDLFDKYNYDYARINALLFQPSKLDNLAALEKVMLAIFDILKPCICHRNLFESYLLKVLESQEKSRKQNLSSCSNDELQTYMEEKGEVSMLLYRCVFSNACEPNDLALVAVLGQIGQFENDIFDIYDDLNDGIPTLANKTTQLSLLQSIYDGYKQKLFAAIAKVKHSGKAEFSVLCRLIVSRADVALRHYQSLAIDGHFVATHFPRNKAICNMETAANFIRLLRKSAERQ